MKRQAGFTALEGILVLVVLGIIGAVSYTVLHRASHEATVAASNSAQDSQTPAAPIGTTESINNLTSQDASSESAIETRHSSSDQAAAQNTNSAAANVGGAYDESTF